MEGGYVTCATSYLPYHAAQAHIRPPLHHATSAMKTVILALHSAATDADAADEQTIGMLTMANF